MSTLSLLALLSLVFLRVVHADVGCVGECSEEQDETSLVQLKKTINFGSDRSTEEEEPAQAVPEAQRALFSTRATLVSEGLPTKVAKAVAKVGMASMSSGQIPKKVAKTVAKYTKKSTKMLDSFGIDHLTNKYAADKAANMREASDKAAAVLAAATKAAQEKAAAVKLMTDQQDAADAAAIKAAKEKFEHDTADAQAAWKNHSQAKEAALQKADSDKQAADQYLVDQATAAHLAASNAVQTKLEARKAAELKAAQAKAEAQQAAVQQAAAAKAAETKFYQDEAGRKHEALLKAVTNNLPGAPQVLGVKIKTKSVASGAKSVAKSVASGAKSVASGAKSLGKLAGKLPNPFSLLDAGEPITKADAAEVHSEAEMFEEEDIDAVEEDIDELEETHVSQSDARSLLNRRYREVDESDADHMAEMHSGAELLEDEDTDAVEKKKNPITQADAEKQFDAHQTLQKAQFKQFQKGQKAEFENYWANLKGSGTRRRGQSSMKIGGVTVHAHIPGISGPRRRIMGSHKIKIGPLSTKIKLR